MRYDNPVHRLSSTPKDLSVGYRLGGLVVSVLDSADSPRHLSLQGSQNAMSQAFRFANFKHLMKIASSDIWQLKGSPDTAACFFESPLSVDADGAPKAYGPHGLQGTLDDLGNAGHPGNWWGILTDDDNIGNPIVQNGIAPKQPCAGFYISQTSLVELVLEETDVRRYADATTIPYFALPFRHFHRKGVQIGDLALVINATNGKFCYAVFADSKSDKPEKLKVGEFSIAAADAIGAPTDARSGSLTNGIITLLFPGSGIGQGSIPDPKTIAVAGQGFLEHFSNHRDKDNKLFTAFPEYPLFATALVAAGY
jgi:hypothetical protein